MRFSVVDAFDIRCAIAVLVHARHHLQDLDASDIDRLDAALRLLKQRRTDMADQLVEQLDRVASVEPDPFGGRTVKAIDQLAVLADVTERSATALASIFRQPT